MRIWVTFLTLSTVLVISESPIPSPQWIHSRSRGTSSWQDLRALQPCLQQTTLLLTYPKQANPARARWSLAKDQAHTMCLEKSNAALSQRAKTATTWSLLQWLRSCGPHAKHKRLRKPKYTPQHGHHIHVETRAQNQNDKLKIEQRECLPCIPSYAKIMQTQFSELFFMSCTPKFYRK